MTGTVIAITADGLPAFDFSEPVLISEYNVMNARPVVTPNVAGFIRPYTLPVRATDIGVLFHR